MIQPQKYIRRPFEVEGVQVTEDNIVEVCEWASGNIEVEGDLPGSKRLIRIKVKHPLNARQTKAYPGDWVLKAGEGFKIYNEVAFDKSFELKHPWGEVHPDQGEIELIDVHLPGVGTVQVTEDSLVYPKP